MFVFKLGFQKVKNADFHQNIYSEVASKKPRKASANKYTIFYQKKRHKEIKRILGYTLQDSRQRLYQDTSALLDIFTNIILK